MQLDMKNSSEETSFGVKPDVFLYHADVPDYFEFDHKCNSHWTTNASNSDVHPHCEILVYVENLKCLFVNDTMYVSESLCFFTFRPGEKHFAIHNKSTRHERYCMWLFQDSFLKLPGGHELLRCLFDRNAGEHNMIILPEDDKREALRLLDNILLLNNSELPERQSLQISNVIQFLSILNKHYLSDTKQKAGEMSELLRKILFYIGSNLSKPLKVADLARQFGISQSTMERMFSNSLIMSPKEYIIRRRMEAAREFLRQGQSATDACYSAGFGDYSRFIADFRRFYGITPAEYTRKHLHKG